MDEKTANQLDRLLAGHRVSGPEADAILERVLTTVEREERRPRRLAYLVAGGVAAAAAVALLYLPITASRNQLTARGTDSGAPVLNATCSAGELSACPSSATLVFSVAGDAASGILSAYAEPLDAGAERVWYFSSEAASAELAASADGTRVFERGVRLSGTHRAGRYRVHAFLADRPLGRDEMLAGPGGGGVRSRFEVDLIIVE